MGIRVYRDDTIQKIRERYYWPSYYKQIEEKVRFNVTNLYSCIASYSYIMLCATCNEYVAI